MPEQEIKSLECKKMEQKETTTDKGESVTFTYTFADEDKDNVVTLKTTKEQDYAVGQDVDVTIGSPQTAIDSFEDETEAEPERPNCELCGKPADVRMNGKNQCAECANKEVPKKEPEPEPEIEVPEEEEEPEETPEPEIVEPPKPCDPETCDKQPEEPEQELNESPEEVPDTEEEPDTLIEHPHIFENPGCEFYQTVNKEDPGMCTKSTRTAPFCIGAGCTDLTTPEEEEIPDEQYEVETPDEPDILDEPDMTENSVVMELLIHINANLSDDQLLTAVNAKFESFGTDEFVNIMNWLAEESYIMEKSPDDNTQLTDKGREMIAPTKVAEEEKGSPETPSQEKKKTAAEPLEETETPSAIFLTDTTVRGVAKQRWECPGCGTRWNRAVDKEGMVTKCKGCGTELMLTIPKKPENEGAPEGLAPSDDPSNKVPKPLRKLAAEVLKETSQRVEKAKEESAEPAPSPPLQDTLDALTNGDGPTTEELRAIEAEDQKPEKTMGEDLKDKVEKEPEIETDPEPDWGMTGNVLVKKTDFPNMNLGGLKLDVTVEKNQKGNFLYAHALSFQVPQNGMQKENFCKELKARTGYDWTHILDSTFNCNKDQLNKGLVSE